MLFSFYVNAQNNKAFLSINAGASISDYTPIRQNKGFNFDIDGAYFITPSMGLGIMLSNQSYKIDDYHYDGIDYSASDIYSGKASYTNILISPCFAIHINKLIIDLKPMIGLSFNSYPASIFTFTSSNYTNMTLYPKTNSTDFSYGGCFAARIFLTNEIAARFFANYGGYGKAGILNTGIGFAYNFKGKE